MSFRLTTPPVLETPAQRLAVLLAQPGRVVSAIGRTRLYITCEDASAEAEFRQQLPHGLAIRGIIAYRLTQNDRHTFDLEISP